VYIVHIRDLHLPRRLILLLGLADTRPITPPLVPFLNPLVPALPLTRSPHSIFTSTHDFLSTIHHCSDVISFVLASGFTFESLEGDITEERDEVGGSPLPVEGSVVYSRFDVRGVGEGSVVEQVEEDGYEGWGFSVGEVRV